MTEAEKQKKLNDIIFKWSRSHPSKSLDIQGRYEYYKKELIENIYCNDFRHSYSQIFHTLGRIDNEDDKYSLEALSLNIEIFYTKIAKDNQIDSDFQKKILKLYDHINLDIARFTYMNTIDEDSKNSIKKVTENLNLAKQSADEAKNKADEVNKKSLNMQKDYVTILGIFASIVITFSFTGTLSTSILANINKVGIFTLLLVISFIGIIAVNILLALYNFILILNEKEKIETKRINIGLVSFAIFFFILSSIQENKFMETIYYLYVNPHVLKLFQ